MLSMNLLSRCRVAALSILLGLTGAGGVAQARTVTDIVGRTVEVPDHPQRILLGEGRFLYAMAIIEGANPLARVVGWQGELQFADPNGYERYLARFPAMARIPQIGRSSEESVNSEQALSLRPDVAVFGLGGHGPGRLAPLVKSLENSGVPVVFIDFRQDPARNTLPSMRILGRALDREAKAEEYVGFVQARIDRIQSVVAKVPVAQRPRVFMELLAGVWDGCCHTTGKGGLGSLLEIAGGVNVAAEKIPGAIGDLSLEGLISADPAFYIATGSRPGANRPMFRAGEGVTRQQAQESLKGLTAREGFHALGAVKSGRVYGLWHNFYDAPTNILALEAMAHWFYPKLLADIDPVATLAEMNRRFFVAVPLDGTYWYAPESKP